jgi:hypothetical protein
MGNIDGKCYHTWSIWDMSHRVFWAPVDDSWAWVKLPMNLPCGGETINEDTQ